MITRSHRSTYHVRVRYMINVKYHINNMWRNTIYTNVFLVKIWAIWHSKFIFNLIWRIQPTFWLVRAIVIISRPLSMFVNLSPNPLELNLHGYTGLLQLNVLTESPTPPIRKIYIYRYLISKAVYRCRVLTPEAFDTISMNKKKFHTLLVLEKCRCVI